MRFNLIARLSVALCAAVAFLSTSSLKADVTLSPLFSDNMVLQRQMSVPVWGWAKSGEKVTVTFAGHSQTTVADSHGNWMIKLPAMKADAAGQSLVVQGANRIVVRNVLVGEVWLCSGQSNMQYPVRGFIRGSTPKKEITSANYPLIRVINVSHCIATHPQKAFQGSWIVCSPHTVPVFSAVAYYYGRDLFNKLHIPIGLITSYWGGTAIQPWTPASGYENTPQLSGDLHQYLARRQQQRQRIIWTTGKLSIWIKQVHHAEAAKEILPGVPMNLNKLRSVLMYKPQEAPTVLFNGMVAPLIPYAIRGAIWYQGENNHADPIYYDRLKALISSWRTHWGEGDFPFYMMQIASFDYKSLKPIPPFVWAAEEKVVRTVPNTGMAGTMDLGMLHNIHPFDKWDMGHRLSLWALAKTYGESGIVYSGPMYKSVQLDGSKAIIDFDYTGGGLKSRDGKPLNCFKIAGQDGKFVPAQAVINGDTVVVSADGVPSPTAVEFAWSYKDQPNLENKEGLPALPFATNTPEGAKR